MIIALGLVSERRPSGPPDGSIKGKITGGMDEKHTKSSVATGLGATEGKVLIDLKVINQQMFQWNTES